MLEAILPHASSFLTLVHTSPGEPMTIAMTVVELMKTVMIINISCKRRKKERKKGREKSHE